MSLMTEQALDADSLHLQPLPEYAAHGDKETRGHVLVIGGGPEMPGSAWLAAMAALRAGAGKLTVATGASCAPAAACAWPEARVIGLPECGDGGLDVIGLQRLEPVIARADCVLVGPGMQDEERTRHFVAALLPSLASKQTILDARAMDALSAPGVVPLAGATLLTPHAGELAHLTGWSKEDILARPRALARMAAEAWRAMVLLKGPISYLALPDGRTWCHNGHQIGLATSGSGDVLAGVVAGLAAGGLALEQAAAWAVKLHALAGARLSKRMGAVGYLASEIAAEIPPALHDLQQTQTCCGCGQE
ncbi:NAD(P)H-hydrate dehydratase [Chitinimonas lacunae]|uniref:ADP-dependent (S)-NAD(P)H-hydrate dehydratase n=1 Tax=Chitinimonas lacunae TaxID=1963018 RepID=A0ABV8MKM5_9NEIS